MGRILWDLSRLLQGVEGVPFGRWEGVKVTGIAIDSQKVRAGDLFVALRGRHADGTRFLPEAVRRGARAAIVPLDCQPQGGVPGLRVAEPRETLSLVSARLFGEPSKQLFVVGVTGTNGKSTVTHMAAQILEAAGTPAGVWSTPEVYSGVRRFRPKLTTPEAHDLHGFFREVVDSGMRAACIEVSSHAVVQRRVAHVRFEAGVVTNLTRDHLDFHPDFEAYFSAKLAFVESLPDEAACVLNEDDPWVSRMAGGARARVISFGFSNRASLRACDVAYPPAGSRFAVRARPSLSDLAPAWFPVEIPVPGRHNVLNALAAVGAGLAAGVPPGTIQRALAGFRPPARRLETTRIGPYTVINDVAMNEASYEAVLETMRLLRFPQLVVVNAVRGNRGPEVNARIASVLARWNRELGFAPLIVTLSHTHVARYEADYRVRPEELDAFVAAARAGGLELCVHEELPDAIREGVDRLEPGGVLLLLGTFGIDEGALIAEEMLRARS